MSLSTELKLHYSTHSLLFTAFLSLSAGRRNKLEKKTEKKHSQCVRNRTTLPIELNYLKWLGTFKKLTQPVFISHQTHNLLIVVIQHNKTVAIDRKLALQQRAGCCLNDIRLIEQMFGVGWWGNRTEITSYIGGVLCRFLYCPLFFFCFPKIFQLVKWISPKSLTTLTCTKFSCFCPYSDNMATG